MLSDSITINPLFISSPLEGGVGGGGLIETGGLFEMGGTHKFREYAGISSS